jgi:ABC-type methionine transport system ATPase subunit
MIYCDKVTASLDSANTDSLLKLLQQINNELNVAVLFAGHDLDVVARLCHRVMKLTGGSLEPLAEEALKCYAVL